MESISNPLPIYIGLPLILVGVLAMYAGVKDRRTAIAVSGFLFLVGFAKVDWFEFTEKTSDE